MRRLKKCAGIGKQYDSRNIGETFCNSMMGIPGHILHGIAEAGC